MKHNKSPNLSSVVHMHPLYVVVAHKSKMEVSPGVAQTGARLAPGGIKVGNVGSGVPRPPSPSQR